MKRSVSAMLLAALLLSGCSRNHFEASLSRPESSLASVSQASALHSSNRSVPFSIGSEELAVGAHAYTYYAVPMAETDAGQMAAQHIKERIKEVLQALPAQFDLSDADALLEIYDGVTCNDGMRFSVLYEGKYCKSKDLDAQEVVFGLTFDASSGQQLALDALTTPDTLSALLLDAQSVKLRTKDETKSALWREALSQKGIAGLSELITHCAPQQTVEQLLAFSFAVESGSLVVTLPLGEEKSTARLSVPLA